VPFHGFLFETCRFLGFFIKLSMFNQKGKTILCFSLLQTLFIDRENLVAGFPLTLSSRARGCAPYKPHTIETMPFLV